jgi:rhodanese-related sulfurtransferase
MTSALADSLEAARRRIAPRAEPSDLAPLLAAGALVVDIRPERLRARDGMLPGAVVVERNVLEWRLEPGGPHRLSELNDAGQVVVVVCDEGYASSLAAAALRDLGLHRATDLAGGYQAWQALVGPVSGCRPRGDRRPARAEP